MTPRRAVTVGVLVVSVVVGGLIALVTAFLIPLRAGSFSYGVAASVLLIGPYAHVVGRALDSAPAATVPSLGWLLTTMYLATMRPEGDLIVTGSAAGLAFLLLGTVSCAVGIGTVRAGIVRAGTKAAERAAVTPNGSSQDAHGR